MKKILNLALIGLCIMTFFHYPQKKYYGCPKIFLKHFKTFEREYGVDLQNQTIYFGYPFHNPHIYGYCHNDGSIEINPSHFRYLSDLGKEALVFHELAHCSLDLDHTDSVFYHSDWKADNRCPTSLLIGGYRTFHDICYKKYRRFYLDSIKVLLFSKKWIEKERSR